MIVPRLKNMARAIESPRSVPVVLFFATAVTRAIFADRFIYFFDMGNFAFAIENGFDLMLHQPHPPGYFLYVMLGRVLNTAMGDAPLTLTFISVLFSALAVPILWDLGRRLYGSRVGVGAAVIGICSPLFWFYGLVGLTYAVECFFSILVAWLAFRVRAGEHKLVFFAAAALALGGGFRPTTMMLLYPLFLYGALRVGYRRLIAAHILAFALVVAWFLPMVRMSSGLGGFVAAQRDQTQHAVWGTIGLLEMARHLGTQISAIAWSLLAALLPIFTAAIVQLRKQREEVPASQNRRFLVLMVLPALLFFTVFISPGYAPGYVLVYMGALYIVAARAVSMETERIAADSTGGAGQRRVFICTLAVLGAVNISAFTLLPYPFSYRDLTHKAQMNKAYVETVKRQFNPDDTLLVSGHHMFVTMRHAGLYLPEYRVNFLYPVIDAYLSNHNGRTERTDEFPLPASTRHIVYFSEVTESQLPRFEHIHPNASAVGGGRYLLYFNIDDFPSKEHIVDYIVATFREMEDLLR